MTINTTLIREADGITVHVAQYRDLSICHTHSANFIEHDGPVGLGTGYRRCVACTVAAVKTSPAQ